MQGRPALHPFAPQYCGVMASVPGARKPDPAPLETDDVRIVAIGAALWLIALVVLAAARLLGAGVHTWWLVMCLCGTVLGLVGVRYCQVRRAAITGDRQPSR